ncbi:MAG: hypothetical protein EXR79_04030 [Myxococcales bacterium]|nr:hypothetical protein [Myxococcales bacterium]
MALGRFARTSFRLALAATCGLLTATTAHAKPAQPKPEAHEWKVSLHDKPVGTETLRIQRGAQGLYYSTQASLQDKVQKVWRSFAQRAHLPLSLRGEVTQYDRWIDVTGATSSTKLFQFQGQWRVATQDAAEDGKKPKPRVQDIKLTPPFVVLDERVQALIALGADHMAKAGVAEFDFVRVDLAITGRMTLRTEHLLDQAGTKWSRQVLEGGSMKLEVLRDAHGQAVDVRGVDGWRAVHGKLPGPKGALEVTTAPIVAVPVEPAGSATPTAK